MKKRYLTLILLILIFKISSAQELKKEYQDVVQSFINYIENRNLVKLKTLVAFPLIRKYPLPDITNGTEFTKRYDEIFDDSLINTIIKSDLTNNWSAVGWKGIMLNNGTLWLDYDGRLLGVNHQSRTEQIKQKKLIEIDRNSIHKSLREFENPILILETKNFRIRIDELSNGVYRFASWSVNTQMNEKPDLIIENGKWIPEGSGGNHKYEFVNGNYKYECLINILGTDETPPADLLKY